MYPLDTEDTKKKDMKYVRRYRGYKKNTNNYYTQEVLQARAFVSTSTFVVIPHSYAPPPARSSGGGELDKLHCWLLIGSFGKDLEITVSILSTLRNFIFQPSLLDIK